MTPGPRVKRALGPGWSGRSQDLDRAKTRGNAGLVRVDRVDRVFFEKSPENLKTTVAADLGESGAEKTAYFSFYLDHLDHLDQESKYKGLAGPGDADNPDQSARHPDHPAPPWNDDRAWIRRWVAAGPTLAERAGVLRAWLATLPPGPLPPGLPTVELRRIARAHGVDVDEARHVARLLAAGERAVAGVVATSDDGELIEGDLS